MNYIIKIGDDNYGALSFQQSNISLEVVFNKLKVNGFKDFEYYAWKE